MTPFSSVIEGVLGTRVAFHIDAHDEQCALRAEQMMLDEFERLEALLSAYRPTSAWSCWRSGSLPDSEVPRELHQVLADAAAWWERSDGAFNPRAGALRDRWLRAVAEQRVPSRDEVATLAHSLQQLPFYLEYGRLHSGAGREELDLHSIAKGWIIDRVLDVGALTSGVDAIVVNAGGDLARHGSGSLQVLVEDPRDAFDNSPPLVRLRLRHGGVATSSGARRPFRIGGHTFHHVIDPRSGWPVEQTLSATVHSTTAEAADVLATVCSVMPPDEATRYIDRSAETGACVLTADGALHRIGAWRDD